METKIVTKQGAVQGLLSQDGHTVIFRGVPYAQPPVGELRFQRPQAHQPWAVSYTHLTLPTNSLV